MEAPVPGRDAPGGSGQLNATAMNIRSAFAPFPVFNAAPGFGRDQW